MASRYRATALAVILSILVVGCGKLEPTARPVPLTPTPIAVAPTDTPLPPTDTPLPPTDTPLPPTDTPIPPTAEPSPTATPTTQPSPVVPPPTEPSMANITWEKTYGADQHDVAGDALLVADGGYFIAGATHLEFEPEWQGDIYLVRTDAAGEVLWEKTYGGERYEEGLGIIQASDGGLVIAGATNSFDAEGMDAYLIKVDQDGNELWSRMYGGPLDEMAGTVQQTADGGYILIGNVMDPNDIVADPGAAGYGGAAGRSNIYLVKTDSEGNELWSRVYDSESNTLASRGLQTPEGGFLVLGYSSYFPENDDDIYLLKVDENGNEVWSRTWEEGISSGHDLIETSDGNYLITGPHSPPDVMDRTKQDFLFIKVDPEGEEVWRRTFGHPDMIDYGAVLAETTDGGYIAAGEWTKDLFGSPSDISLVKLDKDGKLLWTQIIETQTHNMLATILQHPDGEYVIAGSTVLGDQFDAFLIKTGGLAETAELLTRIEELASQDQFSGAVLIAQEGESIFKEAYGLANRSPDTPNQVDTKFNLGSMNKMFTAVAILQLVEQGKLSVNDKIIEHLADYANQEAAEKVTIHHLLTHTSGMGNVFTDEYDRMPKDGFRKPEDWLPLFVDAPLQFEPGLQFSYSNAGYVVLGLIIESVTGQSYYDYVRENIYEPSGMLNTDSYEKDEDVPNLAIGYTTQGYEGNQLRDPISNTDRLPARGFPAGGGYSTVEDLLRFGNALLSHQLLSPESTELLLTGKIELREGLAYAYGFFDRIVGDQRVVGHSGGFPGICDFMDIYVDLGYTVIVLSNTDEGCMPVLEFLREQPLG